METKPPAQGLPGAGCASAALGEARKLGQTRKDPCEQAAWDLFRAAAILAWTVCGADMIFYKLISF